MYNERDYIRMEQLKKEADRKQEIKELEGAIDLIVLRNKKTPKFHNINKATLKQINKIRLNH